MSKEFITLSIEKKIEKSKEIIFSVLTNFLQDEVAIAWSGGKDSTTVLWLVKQVIMENNFTIPKVVFIDDGYVYSEIKNFVGRIEKNWGFKVEFIKNDDILGELCKGTCRINVNKLNGINREELRKIGIKSENPIIEPGSFRFTHLTKTLPLKDYIRSNDIKALITAIRWDENRSRSTEAFFSPRSNPIHTRVHPILHYTEADIWQTINDFSIPFCSLYEKGYRSIGSDLPVVRNADCHGSEFNSDDSGERAQRNRCKEEIMERLRTLGYM